VRRAERADAAAARREFLQVRQLAFVHPALDEFRIHPVEPQDDQLLRKFFWRMARAAAERGAATDDEQRKNNRFHNVCGVKIITSGL
jgi:hypothetical protein